MRKSSPRETLRLAHLSLGERMEDFGTQVSSRSVFNLGDTVPRGPLSASWKEGSAMLRYSELRSPKVRRLWSSSLTWKVMWPLCSTCSEQLVSRNVAAWLQEELPAAKGWACSASSSKEEFFQVVRRERRSVEQDKHTSCLPLLKKGNGIWGWILLFRSKISLYQKMRTENINLNQSVNLSMIGAKMSVASFVIKHSLWCWRWECGLWRERWSDCQPQKLQQCDPGRSLVPSSVKGE